MLKKNSIIEGLHSALLRLATFKQNGSDNPSVLIFASLEFVHADRPIPDSQKLDDKGVPDNLEIKEPNGRLYYRRLALTAERGMEWYNSLREGKCSFPSAIFEADWAKFDGNTIATSLLIGEPKWPKMLMPRSSEQKHGQVLDFSNPFLGAASSPCKIHKLLGVPDKSLNLILENEKAKIWLKNRFHFFFDRYPEYLGGAVLIIPDSDVSSVNTHLVHNNNETEYLITQVKARMGRKLSGLSLSMYEERYGGISTYSNYIPTRGCFFSEEASQEISAIGYNISHNERGLIEERVPTRFLRNISVSVNTLGHNRVKLKTFEGQSGHQQENEYIIDRYDDRNAVNVPKSIEAAEDVSVTVLDRIRQSAFKRGLELKSNNQRQYWLNDSTEARKIIRDIIGSAKENIFLVDPYARPKDVFDFLTFVRRSKCNLNILTTNLARRAVDDREKLEVNTFEEGLLNCIETFNQQGINSVEIRIAPRNLFHDRFLIIDDVVWLSGNSFGNIGAKGSILVKLPLPTPIITELKNIFQSSKIISKIEEP